MLLLVYEFLSCDQKFAFLCHNAQCSGASWIRQFQYVMLVIVQPYSKKARKQPPSGPAHSPIRNAEKPDLRTSYSRECEYCFPSWCTLMCAYVTNFLLILNHKRSKLLLIQGTFFFFLTAVSFVPGLDMSWCFISKVKLGIVINSASAHLLPLFLCTFWCACVKSRGVTIL